MHDATHSGQLCDRGQIQRADVVAMDQVGLEAVQSPPESEIAAPVLPGLLVQRETWHRRILELAKHRAGLRQANNCMPITLNSAVDERNREPLHPAGAEAMEHVRYQRAAAHGVFPATVCLPSEWTPSGMRAIGNARENASKILRA